MKTVGKEKTQFKAGNPGKQKGVQNKINRTVKQAVLDVFNSLQDDPKANLEAFAKKFPRDFYAIAAKLIPTEVDAQVKNSGIIKVVRE